MWHYVSGHFKNIAAFWTKTGPKGSFLTTSSFNFYFASAFLLRIYNFQFAVGDKNGVLQCLSIKEEEPVVQFKTIPGKPITSVQLACAMGKSIHHHSKTPVK